MLSGNETRSSCVPRDECVSGKVISVSVSGDTCRRFGRRLARRAPDGGSVSVAGTSQSARVIGGMGVVEHFSVVF